jgi:cytochrome P450
MAAPKMFDTKLRMEADGPGGLPLANNVRFLTRSQRYAMRTLAPFHDQPVAPVTGGNGSVVLALGEESVKQVFTDNSTFHRAGEGVFNLPENEPYSKMFDAVITANGDEHRRRRRLLMPVVHRSAMDHYREVFAETFAASRFGRPGDGTPFDAVAELTAISKANMLRGMLGLPMTPANERLAGDVLELSAAITRPEVMLLRWNQAFTPYGKWVGRVASVYSRFAALIEERRRSPAGRLDALSIVCATTDEDGDELTTTEIAGELHGLFSAGFETTAMTMAWALLLMLAERTSLDPSDEDALDAMVKESQRLLPAVPMSLPRRVVADVRIGGSEPVPAGSLLWLSSAIEHHRASVYPEPFAYRPERWLDPEVKPPPYAFFPFGIGARRCLGAAFADLQVRVTLGMLAAQGRPLRLLTTEVDYRMKSGVTGAPRKPIMVAFRNRTDAGPPRVTGSVDVLWHQGR